MICLDNWWWSVALPLHKEKGHYLPVDHCEQVLVVVFIISNNQWLSFPFFLLHLTEWIKQAVSGSRPSPALSLTAHFNFAVPALLVGQVPSKCFRNQCLLFTRGRISGKILLQHLWQESFITLLLKSCAFSMAAFWNLFRGLTHSRVAILCAPGVNIPSGLVASRPMAMFTLGSSD